MDKAERTGTQLGIILLDWGKAFDNITHTSLLQTIDRFRVPTKLKNMIKQ